MLWKRPRPDRFAQSSARPSAAAQDELRGYLADRLRLALDFATLGAYELTGEDDAHAAGEADRRRATAAEPSFSHDQGLCRSDRHRRKAMPAHVSGAGRCPIGERDGGGAACTWASATSPGSVSVSRRRLRPGRRAGTVAIQPQPCTWVEPSA